MAHIGYTAARMSIFLDIPFFIRGLCQSLYGEAGRGMLIGHVLLREMENVDPSDPTNMVEEYLYDWWNYERDWQTHSLYIDHLAAYEWHIQKVSELFFLVWR
jgi:hypothetical protein